MCPQTPATAPAKFPRPDSTSATTDVNNTATPVPNSDKFELPYDKLVIAVGAYNQSEPSPAGTYTFSLGEVLTAWRPAFNVPGVKEHAHFLKDIGDARKIRARVLECTHALHWYSGAERDR